MIKEKIHALTTTHKSHIITNIIDYIRNPGNSIASISIDSIKTQSNLNSNTFQNIATAIGVNISNYEMRFHFIDESLLKRRNEIAHGEHVELKQDGCKILTSDVLELIDMYKNDILNLACLRCYMKV